MNKEFLLYITVNNINGKVYGGQHIGYRTDDYIGSGPTIFLKAVKKYGKENFTRRWLKLKINSKQKLDKLERNLIRRLKYKYGKNCYNIHIGGTGGYLLYYCDENYRKEVSKRISIGKKDQYKNGLSELQILGAKKRSLTLKERHKNDEEFKKRHLQKCKENSERLKEFYKKYGLTNNQKAAIKKLREHGHYKLRYNVLYPNGDIKEFVNNYTSFVDELKMEGSVFTNLNKIGVFKIKRRTAMTRHNFDSGCVLTLIERIDY
jgi:hypothetical protein